MTFSNKIIKWIPAILMCLIIFGMSSLPGQTVTEYGLGKTQYHINGHFALYFLLCISFYIAIKNYFKSILLSVIYAFTDEIHQYFVPGRSFEVFDLIVDFLGIILAIILLWIMNTISQKSKKQSEAL